VFDSNAIIADYLNAFKRLKHNSARPTRLNMSQMSFKSRLLGGCTSRLLGGCTAALDV